MKKNNYISSERKGQIMKKARKQTGVFIKFFSLCILSLIMCATFSLKGEATNRTQAEAIQWVKSQVNQYIDADGAYGAQCVDLILAYYDYLGVPRASGNAVAYTYNALPSGWSRIQGAAPQAGDILVYSASSTNEYGHVAIYESDYSTYHQNFNNHSYVERVTYRYNGLSNPYWGVIRPNWYTHTHSYTSKITKNPTCTENGVRTFTCSCGNSYTEAVSATGHNYDSVWTVDVKATCTTTGSQSRHCKNCGAKTDIKTIAKTAHTYSDEWTIEVEPSCLDKTSEWSDWSTDSAKMNNPLYDFETKTESRSRTKSTTTSSSSTLSGWTRYDAKVTSWGNWSAWQNNAVSSSESRQVETRYIAPNYKTVWCYYSYESSDGKRSYTYSAANTTYRYIELDYALAQKGVTDEYNIPRYGSYPLGANGTYLQNCWYASNPATKQVQTSAGYNQYRYRDGNYTYYFYKWSDWSDWSTSSKTANDNTEVQTRTLYRYKIKDEFVNGCKSRTCTVCGEKSELVAIPIEHSYDSVVIIKKPTCTESGQQKTTCSVCNKTYTETIPAAGHKEVIDKAIAATCTSNGKTEGSHCSICNVVIKTQETIPAAGHKEVIDKAVAATCKSEGKTQGSHCSVCGYVIKAQTVIKKIPHTYTSTIKDPTCTTEGAKTYTCSVCGNTYSEPIPAIGHIDDDGDGMCDLCDKDIVGGGAGNCDHICHKGGFAGFIYKIIRIFWKLFKINKTCACGVNHY